MKKILKIACYDFKRLIFNPITTTTLLVLLALSLIFGFVYKIEPTPAYNAAITGETASEVYENFINSNPQDSKSELDEIYNDASLYLLALEDDIYAKTIESISSEFSKLYLEVKEFHDLDVLGKADTYAGTDTVVSNFRSATTNLKNFVNGFMLLEEFKSNVFFKVSDFVVLQEVSTYFQKLSASSLTPKNILLNLYDNRSNFDNLKTIIDDHIYWSIGQDKASAIKENYLLSASEKMEKILEEMKVVSQNAEDEEKSLAGIQSLITNYKLTAECAKYGVKYELLSLFSAQANKHYGGVDTIHNVTPIKDEELKLTLTKINFFLNDDNVYYTQYQRPLNFNTASHKVTAYDHAYLITSIIGFLTILFGIFCAYKLFGKDKKNGKIDIILSQNVTFGQVFIGKFLAIIFTTGAILLSFAIINLIFGFILHGTLPNPIMAVFNLTSVYTISPLLFFVIKIVGIELQVIFWATITVFLMNISRKFELTFAIAIALFLLATVFNVFFNNSLVYCLFPFIHADLTSMLGGGSLQTGFLTTSIYSYGNFYISLIYYLVIVALFFNFTKQLFKKN